MSTKDTGGPAFPGTQVDGGSDSIGCKDGIWHFPGMTLRDYFAAKAMQSLIDSNRYSGVIGVNCYEHTLSSLAYKMADAMLAERNKQ
jgi:hypothetical protein